MYHTTIVLQQAEFCILTPGELLPHMQAAGVMSAIAKLEGSEDAVSELMVMEEQVRGGVGGLGWVDGELCA